MHILLLKQQKLTNTPNNLENFYTSQSDSQQDKCQSGGRKVSCGGDKKEETN